MRVLIKPIDLILVIQAEIAKASVSHDVGNIALLKVNRGSEYPNWNAGFSGGDSDDHYKIQAIISRLGAGYNVDWQQSH